MSLLNQLFNRGVFGSKCKTSLILAISRIKLLQNKRGLHLKHMRTEIAQFLQAGQEAIARIRVEHVIREQNIWAAYEILELFCEFVLARISILESQKECPAELREAIASIIFSAPRCSEIPDLLQIKNLLTTKYGKEFVMTASELRPDSGVNRTIIEKLSVSAPSAALRLKVLKEIAQEHNLEWDSSSTEAELGKKHEDLLSGSKQIVTEAVVSQAPIQHSSHKSLGFDREGHIVDLDRGQGTQNLQAHNPPCYRSSIDVNEIEQSVGQDNTGSVVDVKQEESWQSSDVLERARAAIASADRATVAARAAAELVNAKFGSLKLEVRSS
ncbi:hypothetical protein K2173_000213 [Erythroxylum novogranatense]|uniref:IST1 homolog n=1 Tax=Erythroxylum novogranatense TaxID=1862640 RepID=A0AAV8SVV0_9ROSI|nr:hypothetical protein K2173_000213 [Erythroxylum novogranatense]